MTAKTKVDWKKWQVQTSDILEDSPLLKAMVWLLFIGLLTGLFAVAIINIRPYTLLMGGVQAQSQWISEIPWLGKFLMNSFDGLKYLGAILIWAPIQILQCLWFVISLDAQAQRNAVRSSIELQQDLEAAQQGKSNAESRKAIKRVAKIPFFFSKWAIVLAFAAYSFDLIVGLKVYPIWASWQNFGFWIKSLNPMWMNQDQALNLIIMLFSFEAVLVLTVVVGQWLFLRNKP